MLSDVESPVTLVPEEIASIRSRGKQRSQYETEILEGELTCQGCKTSYPIRKGVPRIYRGADKDFPAKAKRLEAGAEQANPKDERKVQDLFSREWEPFDYEKQTIWHWTLDQRIATFCEEVRVETPEVLRGRLMVDAGCGSGILSMNLAKKYGIEIIAMDMSYVTERAFTASRSNLCHFVQGSVLYPPIAEGVADLTHSHGVLHHTYDTLTAFKAIARLTRPGGQLYVWLYGKKRGWNRIKYMVIRALRFFISRMPRWLQQIVIYALIGFHLVIRSLKRLFGMRLAPINSLGQFLVVTRDRYTPLHAHEHTEQEVIGWFRNCGYEKVSRRTDWKTFYMFVDSTDLSIIGTKR